MKRSTWNRLLVLICCTVFATGAVLAQYRASVDGTVTDPQNKVVAGAQVTLSDKETNRVLTAVTSETGQYRIGGLPPAHYSLTVEANGFKKKVLENIEVLGEQTNQVNITLEVGQTSESVTVSADVVPLLDTESAALGGTISSTEAQNMPAPGRDIFQILQLAPGAFGDGAQAAGGGVNNLPGENGPGGSGATTGIFALENDPQISVGGGRREVNNYQIDGIGVTDAAWGGTATTTPNMDSVKEVQVVTNNYDAEDGRYGGGQVKVITQNGTNQYHGSFFWRAARPGLNAYQRYNGPGNAVVRNNTQLNDLGGSAGAPILRNKLFGFFSYETILTNGAANAQGWFETSQFRQAAPANSAFAEFVNFPGSAPLPGTVLQGASDMHSCVNIGLTEGQNCNTILGQGLDIGSPLTTTLGSQDPTWGNSSSTPGVGSGLDMVPDIQFISQNYTAPTNEQQFHGRVDYNLSSRDLLAFVGYFVPNKNNGFNGSPRGMNAFLTESQNRAITALWDHTFSSSMQNEFRGINSGWIENNQKNNPNAPFGLPIIGLGNLGGYNPLGTIGLNGFGVGTPVIFDQSTYGGKDVLTKVYKSHTLKLGGEFTRLLFVDDSPWNARPNYTFNNVWDMMNDAPVTESATFNSVTGVPTDFRRDTRETLYAFFAQDSYKIKPNLTLTAGLRWDYFGPMSEKYGHLAVVELGSGNQPISNVQVRKGGNLFNAQRTNFGPQLGAAWSPEFAHQKLVVRGGFGIGYTALQEANTLDGRNNPPYLSGFLTLTGSQILYGPNAFPSNPKSFYGYASNPATTATLNPNTNLPVPNGQNFALAPLQAYQANLPTTATYRYSLDLQYDLGKQWVASLGYQGTQSRHLTRLYNYTLYEYAKLAASGDTSGAFNPSVQNVNMYDDEGSGSFSAALLGLRHRFGNSFELESDYRLARGTDSGSSNYAPAQGGGCQCEGQADGPYEYYPMNLDKGPSDFDVHHAEKVFGVWTPQFFKGRNKLAEKLLGAWTLSGIFNTHTGFPWTATDNNLGGDAVFQTSGSGTYGGGSPMRPFAYLGGLKTGDFKTQNYPNGATNIFPENVMNGSGQPCYVPGPSMSDIVNGLAQPGPIPCAPAIGRNIFRGPHYFDIDATIGKSIGLPSLKVVGEHGSIDFHANIYNLFNNTNLTGVDNNIPDTTFGEALGLSVPAPSTSRHASASRILSISASSFEGTGAHFFAGWTVPLRRGLG